MNFAQTLAMNLARFLRILGSLSMRYGLMGAIALTATLLGGQTGAIAQSVSNQSDVTGATPDIIYTTVGDLGTDTTLGLTADALADDLGDAYTACMADFNGTIPPTLENTTESCQTLDSLLRRANTLLEQAEQQHENTNAQLQSQRLW